MTDDLDSRLRGLVDDIEPAVLISPAGDARARGSRRKLRRRATAGIAAAAAVGAIATGFVALSGSDERTTGAAAATPGSKAGGLCRVPGATDPASGVVPSVGAPSSFGTGSPDGAVPPITTPAGGVPSPSGFRLDCDPPAGTVGPLSPKALRAEDLPAAPGGWGQSPDSGEAGSWSGTVEETRYSPGAFCLSQWPVTGNAPGANLVITRHRFGGNNSPSGSVNETIATYATEADAQAAEAKLAEDAAACQSRYPQASLTRLGTGFWKWDHAPDTYRGYEGFIRSGKTIVVIGYTQAGAFATEFEPQILQTAIDRATS